VYTLPPPPQNFNVTKQNTLSILQILHTNFKMRKLIMMKVFQLALELVRVKVIRRMTKIMFNHL